MSAKSLAAIALTAWSLVAGSAGAVSAGQADTFEDGTTQGWRVGLAGATHPAPPANMLGGPDGANDRFMMLTAVGGSAAGNRLTAINFDRWGGNYTVAGITGMRMDLRNFGQTDLALRLLIENPTTVGGGGTSQAFSTTPILLPAGGDWTRATFALAASDLSPVVGSVTNALETATTIRLYHSTAAWFPGESVKTQLGVDNITALPVTDPVPEPATAALLGLGVLALGAVVRRRRS